MKYAHRSVLSMHRISPPMLLPALAVGVLTISGKPCITAKVTVASCYTQRFLILPTPKCSVKTHKLYLLICNLCQQFIKKTAKPVLTFLTAYAAHCMYGVPYILMQANIKPTQAKRSE